MMLMLRGAKIFLKPWFSDEAPLVLCLRILAVTPLNHCLKRLIASYNVVLGNDSQYSHLKLVKHSQPRVSCASKSDFIVDISLNIGTFQL